MTSGTSHVNSMKYYILRENNKQQDKIKLHNIITTVSMHKNV